jgi:hypothetical protein
LAKETTVFEQQQERSPHAELADQLDGAARGPVLHALAVLEAADDDAARLHSPTAMGATRRAARGTSIGLGELFVDREARVREELQIQRDGPTSTLGPPVLGRADVVDEACTVGG